MQYVNIILIQKFKGDTRGLLLYLKIISQASRAGGLFFSSVTQSRSHILAVKVNIETLQQQMHVKTNFTYAYIISHTSVHMRGQNE